ncbi:MAG: acyl-CoA dehydrogenase family protein [Myxococcales bacterium]|nr:acyl-CoA dehydrogenase family protein [Myxococcales bacterium]
MSAAHPHYTEEHQAFRQSLRRWVEREILPHVEAWEAARAFPRELYAKAAEIGLLGMGFPEAYGGVPMDPFHVIITCEELARAAAGGLSAGLMSHSIGLPPVAHLGSEALKARVIPPVLAGEKISALAVTEPSGGSDVANLRTTARRDGDHYVLNGQKTFITSGMRADFITCAVRTGGEGMGGISIVVVPGDAPGLARTPLEKMGWWCSDTATLYFDECRVPAENLVGEENMGFYHIMTNFQGERLIAAVSCVAGMELAVRDAIAYGDDRKAFGKPVSKFQVWRHKLVEHMTAIEAARRLTYYAVDKFNKNPANATREITMAKLFAGDLAQRVIYDCQQMYGGFGYVTEYAVARAFTDVRLITIGGGTSEVMKEILVKMEGL